MCGAIYNMDDLLKNPRGGNMDKNKIEVFGRVLSQKEIEHVFLKAKKLQEENKILKEGLQKFRSVGV